MKLHTFLLMLIFLTSSAGLLAEDDTPLEGEMKILARGTRQLSQQVSDPSKQQENISLIENLKKAALESKAFSPRKISSIPVLEREKFLTDYKTDLDELKDAFEQIQESIKAGQFDKAKSKLAAVNSIKKEGHTKFKQD